MIHQELEKTLRAMGLTGCYQGYACLVYAAMLLQEDPTLLELPSKRLYPKVSRLCQITRGSVDQAIRTAIQVCFRRSPDAVSRLCGSDGMPRVQQFLSALANSCSGRQR